MERVQDEYNKAEYQKVVDDNYIKDRIRKHYMYGAFYGDELAGFAGIHNDDSIGMLRVLPEYRGRNIGKALQTFIMNKMIDMGWIPYGQFMVGDVASENLQKKLGLHLSKTPVIWLE